MFKTARTLLIAGVFSILYFVLSVSSVSAQTSVQTQPQPQDLHNYTQNVMIEVASSLTCMLAGIDAVDPSQKCLGIANGKIGPVDSTGGAIGAMGGLIAMTFTPTIHTSDFVGYMAGNFGITKPALAAVDPGSSVSSRELPNGIGFAGLSPLLKIWTTFRDITYLLFVLIFIAIGFAIMLRVHIDPRTVMSIENQIPKIIVGLILVTFSFAIVGLMIDLMWVFMYLIFNVFMSIPKIDVHCGETGRICLKDAINTIQGDNAIGAFNNFVGFQNVVTQSAGAVKDILFNLLTKSFNVIPSSNWWDIFINISAVLQNIVGALIAGFAGFLALIIIAIAVLFSLFRLWFQLIKAYVMILIVAVFSPFWILAGLLPGSRLSFTSLLRELGSNLITFPATLVMFLLAKTFIDVFAGPNGHDIFVPPFVGNLGGADGPRAIGALAGLGIILLTPDVIKMMRKALQAPEFDFSAIGTAISAGGARPRRAIGAGVTALETRTDQQGQLVYRTGPIAAAIRLFGLGK